MAMKVQEVAPAGLLESIGQFEAHYGYNADYIREIVTSSQEGAAAYQSALTISQMNQGVPAEAWFTAKIYAVKHEDCGPCLQLVIKMAEEAGVQVKTLEDTLIDNEAALSADASLGYRFAKATMAHDATLQDLREEILGRWGMQALVSLSFAIVSAKIFPTLRTAMGFGQSCQRVMVNGQPVTIKH